jgi:PAS domain S-box-containing protein
MKTCSILLIADEGGIRANLGVSLRAAGYDVATAGSGEEALTVYTQGRFDIVVMDLNSRDTGGIETLKSIQAMSREMGLIVITGNGDAYMAGNDALLLGADDYMLKTRPVNELIVRIERWREKKEATTRLQMYAAMLASTRHLMAMISPDHEFLMVNDAWAQLLDKDIENIIGTHVADHFGQEFFERCMKKPLVQCFSGRASQQQHPVSIQNSNPRFYDFSYAPHYAGNGKISAAVLNILDITEYNRLALQLQESERRLRLALDAASDGVFDRDLITGESYYGENWAALLGYTLEEVRAQKIRFEELLHPDDREKTLKAVREHLAGKTDRYVAEFRLRTKSGDWQWILARGKAIRGDGAEKPQRFIGTHTNINSLKEAETALRSAFNELEDIVEHRTREIVQQHKKLEDTNIALAVLLEKREQDKKQLEDRMISNIKMLVTPYLDKLKNSPLNERQSNFLKILETNLQDVLSPFIYRLSTQHLNFTPAEIQIANLIKDGKTSKEIAEIMNLSPETISNHRKHIRKKSGLTNTKSNLRAVLSSFLES